MERLTGFGSAITNFRRLNMGKYIIGAIAVLLFLALIALCSKRNITGKTFVCPYCKRRFRQEKRKNVYFSNMGNNSAFLKCPYCKKRGICNESRIDE